jgi:hypothetical protein
VGSSGSLHASENRYISWPCRNLILFPNASSLLFLHFLYTVFSRPDWVLCPFFISWTLTNTLLQYPCISWPCPSEFSWTLKMEAAYFYETLVSTYSTTWCHDREGQKPNVSKFLKFCCLFSIIKWLTNWWEVIRFTQFNRHLICVCYKNIYQYSACVSTPYFPSRKCSTWIYIYQILESVIKVVV